MEIQGEDGTNNLVLKEHTYTRTEFGRSKGFNTTDKTVSRSHVVLELLHPTKKGTKRLSFEVVGKNPIWVRRQSCEKVEVFKRGEVGELMAGDVFCLSGKNPVWFSLKSVEDDESTAGISDIDPVKEFGFLVIGHEFDNYPKKMIRDVKEWNWFLEEPSKEIDDDEDEDEDAVSKNSTGNWRGKRKKGKDNDNDDDWTGESDDDKEFVTKLRKLGRPKYSTRSKDHDKRASGSESGKGLSMKSSAQLDEDVEDESEDEDTLGRFIVDEEDEDFEEISNIDEEEEEEEEDDDDDNEDIR